MELKIKTKGWSLTEALRNFTELKSENSLGRFSSRVNHIIVRLSDINAHKGGIDKECKIIARMRPSFHVMSETRDTDMYEAVSRAFEKMAYNISRKTSLIKKRHGSYL